MRLNIRKTLRGAVESQSNDGETVKLGEAITTDNPMSRLTGEIPLKSGEERIVNCRYRVWVLSHHHDVGIVPAALTGVVSLEQRAAL